MRENSRKIDELRMDLITWVVEEREGEEIGVEEDRWGEGTGIELEVDRSKTNSKKERKDLANTKGSPIRKEASEKTEGKLKEIRGDLTTRNDTEEERLKANPKKERKIFANTKGTPTSKKKNSEKIEEKLSCQKTPVIRKEQIKYPHTPMVQEKVVSWLKELKVLKEQLIHNHQ